MNTMTLSYKSTDSNANDNFHFNVMGDDSGSN